MLIGRNAKVLFQGDSITYAGRSWENDNVLGIGYAMIAAAWFHSLFPERNVTFLNRGVSGDTTLSLKNRWEKDCIDLKPDVVSILVGINDCWRRYDKNQRMPLEDFTENYRTILKRTAEELDALLVVCEPFLLPVTEEQTTVWREDLDPKIQAVRALARDFGAVYVPFDGIFAQVSAKKDPAYWAADGVHPSPAGHALMARSWLQAVGAL